MPNRDCTAFWIGDTPVTVGEVLRAALFRGDLNQAAKRLSRKMACTQEAERLGLDLDGEAVEQRVSQFRYDNDLISAEEAEAWLVARGLDADEFQAYFDESFWVDYFKGKDVPDSVDPLSDLAENIDSLGAEVLLSGGFGALAVELSRRLTVRADPGSLPGPGERDGALARFYEGTGIEPASLADWLASIGRDQAWFEAMLEMEAAYGVRREAILTPGQLSRELAMARLSLTRMEIESIEFDGMDAAREGHLCVRDDGLSLEAVAHESGYPYKHVEVLAEDLPEDQRQNLLCARIGDILEPSVSGELIYVHRVLAKAEPELDDPFVRSRIEQRVLKAHFSGAKAGEIRWLIT